MAYRDFTLVGGSGAFARASGRLTPRAIASPLENLIKKQFDLNIVTGVFFTDLPKLIPRE
jgi:hypothetical protein